MTSFHIRSLAFCAGLATIAAVLAGGSAAQADPPTDDGTVNPSLTLLAESGSAPDSPQSAEESGLSTEGDNALVVDDADRVLVSVEFEDAAAQQAGLPALAALGEVDRVARSLPEVFIYVTTDRFDDLAAVPGVREVSPALSPIVSDSGGPAVSDAAAAAAPAPAAVVDAAGPPCRAIPSDVDSALGTGVVVGILSDSFEANTARTTPEQDVAAGALPGPGNPCGYETPVDVLVDVPPGSGSDEGRAMAQIVHSAAPGATLLFAAAGPGQSTLADSVRLLRDAGATVIVDDVWFPEETLWQRGVVATAIAEANDAGITLLSSAGNATELGRLGEKDGQSIGSWETTAFSPMDCPSDVLDSFDGALPQGTLDCADMSGGTADPRATLDFSGRLGKKGGTIMLQWSEPMYGVTTQIYPVVVDRATGKPVGVRVQNDLDTASAFITLPASASTDYELSLVRARLDPATATPDSELHVKWKTHSITLSSMQDTPSPEIVVGPTVWAHAGDPATIAVAAASVLDTSQLETFSGSGPSTYLFQPLRSDRTPSPRYADPISLFKPQITGVDGEQTTFFGQNSTDPNGTDQPDVWRFYGTSAAAPSVAGIVALAKSAAPAATDPQIRTQLLLTADEVSVNSAYAGPTTAEWVGAGLVDPDGLMSALVAPVPPTPTPVPDAVPAAAGARLADTGTDAGAVVPLLAAAGLAFGLGTVLTLRRRRARSRG